MPSSTSRSKGCFRRLTVAALVGAAALLPSASAFAETVTVRVAMRFGDETSLLFETNWVTGAAFTCPEPSAIDGWLFTHWRSDGLGFSARDAFGRAYDTPSCTIYDAVTTFTADYVTDGLDGDGDGLADGIESYWYGDLDETPESDTDGDGKTFAEELELGTNPHFADASEGGDVLYDDGPVTVYNLHGWAPYVIRCEPEGALFETVTEYLTPGTNLTTEAYDTLESTFAYWSVNGVPQRDTAGRALDAASFVTATGGVEVVAVCVSDADTRAKLYWYGTTNVLMTGDSDGDGVSFADELAAGTNPLFADSAIAGDVLYDDSAPNLYNPSNYAPYVIRSDPEGALFATISEYVSPGTEVTTPDVDAVSGGFAGWTLDGVTQRDALGRALDSVTFTVSSNGNLAVARSVADAIERASLYWYGTNGVAAASDTDGDGYTLAQEVEGGTNPLLADIVVEGDVLWDDGAVMTVNQQFYEQVTHAIVDGQAAELFTSAFAQNDATSMTFGGEGEGRQIWPVVADVNGDGLWDLIVVSATTTNVFVNTGTKGNPQFEERGGRGATALPDDNVVGRAALCPPTVDLSMNSTAKLAEMSLDVAPVGALSATTNGATLLVSDEEGRIWYYSSTAIDGNRELSAGCSSTALESNRQQSTAVEYTLAHRVWGGSYAGFARGLRLAAVDWDDDGDLDCLCGTAEGKLMLLRDPKVGRPTGLTAAAGVDNVNLEWEPNGQSRVRGYRVYKATKATEGTEGTTPASQSLSSLMSLSSLVASVPLPRYRDEGLTPATYAYKVSALSRFYTAGNSTPTETESVATEPVSATVGGVTLSWSEPVWRLNCDKAGAVVSSNVIVNLIINNSLNYDATGLVVSNVYDAAKWRFLKVETTGLSEKLKWKHEDGEAPVDAESLPRQNEDEMSSVGRGKDSASTRVAVLRVTGGEVAAGGGVFFTFVFEDLTADPKVLMGDVDGNGVLEGVVVGPGHTKHGDLWLLGKLKDDKGRNWTAYQLKAGDFNGNNGLDDGDYQALRQLLKERGEL